MNDSYEKPFTVRVSKDSFKLGQTIKKRKFEKRIILYLSMAVIFLFVVNGNISSNPGTLMAASGNETGNKTGNPGKNHHQDQNIKQNMDQDKDKKEGEDNKNKDKDNEKKVSPIIHEIEVVAKRVPQDHFKTSRSVTLMNLETMRKQSPRTVPEALYDTPGTFVQQTNHGGGSPIIRGMIGPQLLIMVDGIRFNNSTYRTGPGQYLNLIDTLGVDRIEILRGPGSVLYGSDAMGGVIRVTSLSGREILENPEEKPETSFFGNLLSRYQSANQGTTLHGNFVVGDKNLIFLGGGGYKKFNDLRGGRGVGIQPYVGYDQTSAWAKVVRRFSGGFFKDWRLTLSYLFTSIDDAGRTDKLYDNNSLQVYDNIDHLVYGNVRMVYPSLSTEGNITFSYQHFFERKDNNKVEDDYATVKSTLRDEVAAGTIGLDINMITRLKEKVLHMNYGLMWYRDSVNAERFTRNTGEAWHTANEQNYPDGSTYTNYGMYAFIEWDPVHLKSGGFFRLSGGYRMHGMSAKVPGKDELPPVDFFHPGHVFLCGIQYLHRDQLNMSFTFSQGFRSPNLQESVMLGDTGKYFHVPNDDLDPEQSDTFELLVRRRFGSLSLSWTGYVSFLKSLIKRENTLWQGETKVEGKDVVHNVNASPGFLWGIEGSFLLGLSGHLSLGGHLTYTWGEEKNMDGENIPLTRIPPLFGQLTFRYETLKRGGWQGFVETYIRAAAKQDRLSKEDINDVRIPPGGTPGWWTWNIRAGVLLPDHIRLSLGVENIFNRKYKYHASGIYSPGTDIIISLEIF